MNISKKILSLGLAPCLLILLAIGICFYLISVNNRAIEKSVSIYVQKQIIVSEIFKNLGYSKGIHAFKNYVLRNDDLYRVSALEGFTEAKSLIQDYLSFEKISEIELKTMNQLEQTINNYIQKLPEIEKLIKKSVSAKRIDQLVKIDDTASIIALNKLNHFFLAKRNSEFKKIESFQENAILYFLITFISIFVAVLIVSRKVYKNLQSSIKRLTHISKKVTKGESIYDLELDARRSSQEIYNLEKNLVSMSQKVGNQISSIKKSNKDLENFAAVASHDIRAPFHRISAYADLLSLEYGDELKGEGEVYLTKIKQSITYIQNMIQSVLSYARLSSEEIEIKEVDLNKIMMLTIENLETLIKESKAQIIYGDLPKVLGSEKLICRLFQNLLSNAIKFKEHDNIPKIEINAIKVNSARWRISVQDNGVGFDDSKVEHILSPFGRFHSQEQFPGTGIGLAECKKILETHQSNFEIQSKEGLGSNFSFELNA